jgi:UDP-N-acetylglucosamine/UDP-N-acetylgalactosamine diphosphorylase
MYPIGPVSGVTLLQVHLEKALAAARRYGAAVPVYMMTSPVTHDEQVVFLDAHERFGLAEDDLVVFCQGTMPAVDAKTGQLLLAAKDDVFLSPNGHGGTVAALADSGAIEHMRRRGVKHLFYLQVDNPLTPIADAEFIGYHLLAGSELTSMAVTKQTPRDKLGNFVAVDGRVQVIEYSDFPEDVAERRNADGSLTFWAGSIAVHVLAVDFLERTLRLRDALPFHVAHKKVPYVDDTGRLAAQECAWSGPRHARVRARIHDQPASPLARGSWVKRGRRSAGRNQPAVGARWPWRCWAKRSPDVHQQTDVPAMNTFPQ